MSQTAPEQGAGPGGDFWAYLDRLVSASRVVVDRAKASRHPRYPAIVYPLDYGYLEGTTAMDGGGIDVWLGEGPGRALEALVVTVDLKKRDSEIKLLLGCTADDRETILAFHNDEWMRAWLVVRPAAGRAAPGPEPLEADAPGWRLLQTRRSVRRFTGRPVAQATVQRLLEAATWAPSAHNRQPWRFVVVETAAARQRLAQEMGAAFRRDLLAGGLPAEAAQAQVERSRQRIEQAPVLVVVCLDPTVGDEYPDPARQAAERLMGAQGVAMAGQNLLLAAHALGLGGVWVCAPLFAPQAVRLALDLPAAWEPQGMALVGYPAKQPEARGRRAVAEVVAYR